jgi:two-component system, NarL family, response regulator DevR
VTGVAQVTGAGRVTDAARVVIVDDHAIIRSGLRTILEQSGSVRVVGEAGTAPEALAVVARHRPDVVLLDLKLGEDDEAGLAVCRRLTGADPSLKVLVLTTFLNEKLVVGALRSGAKGYVLKDVDADQLLRAIAAVRAGESAFDSHAAAVVVRTMSGAAPAERKVTFTAREAEVVRLLARGRSNRQIGEQLYISETTVKFHVHNVMEKLGVRRRAEVVYRSGQLGLLDM